MTNRTALITCVNRYMSRAVQTKFEALGITVVTTDGPLTSERACTDLIAAAGEIDILVANLAEPPMTGPVQNIDNADWNTLFDALVHPLMYLVRAVTPQMLARRAGKIIAVDAQAWKFDLARDCGATDCIDASDGTAVQAVMDLTGGGETIDLEDEDNDHLQLALAESIRSLCDAAVSTNLPASAVDAVREQVDSATGALLDEQHDGPYSGLMQLPLDYSDPHALLPLSPIIGPFNPTAPDIALRFEAGRVLGRARLGKRHIGPPGAAHGGITSMIADQIVDDRQQSPTIVHDCR